MNRYSFLIKVNRYFKFTATLC